MGCCLSTNRSATESGPDTVPLNQARSNITTTTEKGDMSRHSITMRGDDEDESGISPVSEISPISDYSSQRNYFPTAFGIFPFHSPASSPSLSRRSRATASPPTTTAPPTSWVLGTSPDSPLYTITSLPPGTPGGGARRGGLRLDSPAPGEVRPSVGGMIATLPELNDHNREYGGDTTDEEEVARSFLGGDDEFSFGVEVRKVVGGGKVEVRRERFEWRRSRDGDDEKKEKMSEWRLLRRGASSSSLTSSTKVGGGNEKEEVVARCSYGVSGATAMSASNTTAPVMEFEFVGEGATGSMGGRWELMAVLSALGLWHTASSSLSC